MNDKTFRERVKYDEVIVLAQMDNTIDHTFESANRVYSKYGCCPTIPTCAGGNIQPKILVDLDKKSAMVEPNIIIRIGFTVLIQ